MIQSSHFLAEEGEPLLNGSEILFGISGKFKYITNYSQIVLFPFTPLIFQQCVLEQKFFYSDQLQEI